jgi:site-specific recombinase XerD
VFNQIETQGTLTKSLVDDYLLTWFEAYLIDRKVRGLADGTLHFYCIKLKLFSDFCEPQVATQIHQITPTLLRHYLLYCEETGHNEGGRYAAYRSLRAFLYWYEDEIEPEGWKNPIRKVKAPKVAIEPVDPVPMEVVSKMVKACERGTYTGDKDAAILLCLLDTGARASQFLAIDLDDINQVCGDILIRQGKGRNPRTVYIGKHSKRAIRRYLKHRKDNSDALWVTHPHFGSERLGYDGLWAIITRSASIAGVIEPLLHDFQRAFCLAMLREGTDIFTLAKLMGHESTAVLQRYIIRTNQDTEQAHRRLIDQTAMLAQVVGDGVVAKFSPIK